MRMASLFKSHRCDLIENRSESIELLPCATTASVQITSFFIAQLFQNHVTRFEELKQTGGPKPCTCHAF